MVGYTALALAGGEPTAFEHETANGQRRAVTVVHDARIRALVLMAPAAAWYAEGKFTREGERADLDAERRARFVRARVSW